MKPCPASAGGLHSKDVVRFRIGLIATALLLAVVTACGDEGDAPPAETGTLSSPNGSTAEPVTPVARPDSVPQTAQAIGQTTTLGRFIRQANEPPEAIETRILEGTACEDDVLVFETSEETIYAALPCDRFEAGIIGELLLDKQVAILLEVTESRFRVLFKTEAGAQVEFTVFGIWVA